MLRIEHAPRLFFVHLHATGELGFRDAGVAQCDVDRGLQRGSDRRSGEPLAALWLRWRGNVEPVLDPAFNRCLERSLGFRKGFVGSLALGDGFGNIAAGNDISSVLALGRELDGVGESQPRVLAKRGRVGLVRVA